MCYGGEGQQQDISDRGEFNESLLIYWSNKPIGETCFGDGDVETALKGDRVVGEMLCCKEINKKNMFFAFLTD